MSDDLERAAAELRRARADALEGIANGLIASGKQQALTEVMEDVAKRIHEGGGTFPADRLASSRTSGDLAREQEAHLRDCLRSVDSSDLPSLSRINEEARAMGAQLDQRIKKIREDLGG